MPLALLRIRTAPRKDLGVSPYEMMFGLPCLGNGENVPIPEAGDPYVQKYTQTVARTLSHLREQGRLPQTPPLDFYIHKIQPGDWVLIRSWKEDDTLKTNWEGLYQVLLTTETAIQTKKRGWTHAAQVKGPVDPLDGWAIYPHKDPLKLTIRKKPCILVLTGKEPESSEGNQPNLEPGVQNYWCLLHRNNDCNPLFMVECYNAHDARKDKECGKTLWIWEGDDIHCPRDRLWSSWEKPERQVRLIGVRCGKDRELRV